MKSDIACCRIVPKNKDYNEVEPIKSAQVLKKIQEIFVKVLDILGFVEFAIVHKLSKSDRYLVSQSRGLSEEAMNVTKFVLDGFFATNSK